MQAVHLVNIVERIPVVSALLEYSQGTSTGTLPYLVQCRFLKLPVQALRYKVRYPRYGPGIPLPQNFGPSKDTRTSLKCFPFSVFSLPESSVRFETPLQIQSCDRRLSYQWWCTVLVSCVPVRYSN